MSIKDFDEDGVGVRTTGRGARQGRQKPHYVFHGHARRQSLHQSINCLRLERCEPRAAHRSVIGSNQYFALSVAYHSRGALYVPKITPPAI